MNPDMKPEVLRRVYAGPLDLDDKRIEYPGVDYLEELRRDQIGRVITQEGMARGGLVMSYSGGMHQVALRDGRTINLVWLWERESDLDPPGVSSRGWRL